MSSDEEIQELRVGIAGYGMAGSIFHAPLIHATPGLKVGTIVTGDPERGRKAVETYPGVRIAASVDEILGDIDLLVVATPNRYHAKLALAAIEHGIPVVVDKPFATSIEDAEKILSAGGRVTVFQNRRWDGDFLTAKSLVEEGRLGEIVRFDSYYERFRPRLREGFRESSDPDDAGGQLADIGPHLIDQAIQLFGVPTSVYGEVDIRRPGAKVDDDVFIALTHQGGIRSHLHMGVVEPMAGPRMRLRGQAGGFAVDGLDTQESQLKEGGAPGDRGYGEREPGTLVMGAEGVQTPIPIEKGDYVRFYVGVNRWLRIGGVPPVDPADSLTVMRVMDAARQSSAAGQVVDFG